MINGLNWHQSQKSNLRALKRRVAMQQLNVIKLYSILVTGKQLANLAEIRARCRREPVIADLDPCKGW